MNVFSGLPLKDCAKLLTCNQARGLFLKVGGSHGRSTQWESPREMALASFMIELEFLGHIHDQHRDLGHVSRGLALLTRRGKTLIALSTLWQGNAEFEPSPASTTPD